MGYKAAFIALGLFACQTIFADAIEVILSSSVLETKDAKTLQNYVLKGNKTRVFSKVSIHAKGYANRGLRQWLERRLPNSIDGYFEREDKDTGLSVRFKPVSFQLKRNEIFCTAASTVDQEVCHAEFAISGSNAVDIPSGEGGEHRVLLQMLPPSNDLRAKVAKPGEKIFFVLTGEPKQTMYSFAGLPQH